MMRFSSMLVRNTNLCTNINQFQLCAFSSKAPEMIKIETVGEKQNVALIKLNRPKALNALRAQLMAEFADALESLNTDKSVGAIVITGSERAFAACADIKEMTNNEFASTFSGSFHFNWTAVSDVKKPVIAAVNGFALGGGNELAMMCDIIYAGEKARFGQPEINIGTIPGAGGTQRWARAAGKSFAMEVCLTGNHVSAQEAKEHGIVSKVFPVDQVVGEAVKLGEKIADQSPLIVQMAKEAVNKAYDLTLQEGLHFKRRLFYTTFATKNKTKKNYLPAMVSAVSIRSFSSTRSKVIDSLQNKFDGKVLVTDVPALRITVESTSFKFLPKEEQYQQVLNTLPEEWKLNVIIETNAIGNEVDRKIRPVCLRDVSNLTGELVAATPQSLLDDSVFLMKKRNGILAAENLWLCASLALKNFSIGYKRDPRNHKAKSLLVQMISSQCGNKILTPWSVIERCHQNGYEDRMFLAQLKDAAKQTEMFCNILYDCHQSGKFDFDAATPEWMQQYTKSKSGNLKKVDMYFHYIQ